MVLATLRYIGIALFALQVSSAMAQGFFYRYVDDKGKHVMTSTLPEEALNYGYEVYNAKTGQLVEKVPPKMSVEEIAEKEKREAEEKRLAEWDAKLRRKYSSSLEIEAARVRQVEKIQADIDLLNSTIEQANNQIEEQERLAANIERQGRQVPDSVSDTIASLKLLVDEHKKKISMRRQQQRAESAEYQKDIDRYKYLESNGLN